jgi:Rhodopirellula transposase DDE domain
VQTQKKIKQTDAIFAKLKVVNTAADQAETVLRLSWDAKTTVKIGDFVRGGKNRLERKGADHDFKPEGILNPFGIFLPQWDDLHLYFTASPVTSDFIVDVLERWWRKNRKRFPRVDTLVINQDNGPEIHSRRTQFLKRMVQFAREYALLIRLAYYPPYHSKYNAIEHCWGILENHWNGELLDNVDAVLGFARTMTWNGRKPEVELVNETYVNGVRLSPREMKIVEEHVARDSELGKWFLDIDGPKLKLG